jgi:hypothetical protein
VAMAPPQPWLRLTPTLPFSLDDAAAWISQHGHPQIPPASVPLALELDLLRHEVVRRLRVLREPRAAAAESMSPRSTVASAPLP